MDKSVSESAKKSCSGLEVSALCNPKDVQYVSSRCCVTYFLADSSRFRLERRRRSLISAQSSNAVRTLGPKTNYERTLKGFGGWRTLFRVHTNLMRSQGCRFAPTLG